jgi:hypothetical protein
MALPAPAPDFLADHQAGIIDIVAKRALLMFCIIMT